MVFDELGPRLLRVALVVPYYEPAIGDDPRQAIERQPALSELARSMAARGVAVGAFQLFPVAASFIHAGALFRFVPASPASRRLSQLAHRAFPRYQAPYYEPATALVREIIRFGPDIVHAFGATLDLNLLLASIGSRRIGRPLVVNYHGGLPRADRLTRQVRKHNLHRARRVLFTHRDLARPWIESGLLPADRVEEALETSTTMRPVPRAVARAKTRIQGDPACVMVGRLEQIKDPLTSLLGFALVAERRPLARLYVYSLSDALRRECEALTLALPSLAGRVEFRGRAARSEMPAIYSASDFLIQSSRREWSGLSVLEAMACGAIPVISDIPSFRAITAEGSRGALFERGQPLALAEAVLGYRLGERMREQWAVRHHFDKELSFDALAHRLHGIYGSLAGSETKDAKTIKR